MSADMSDLIRAMHGARMPGGCDRCDAFQEVVADKYGPGAHAINIHHDDWCPELARHQAGNRAQRRAATRAARRH